MAKKTCPQCLNTVDNAASVCPHCGHLLSDESYDNTPLYVEEKRWTFGNTLIVLLLILLIAAVVACVIRRIRANDKESGDFKK